MDLLDLLKKIEDFRKRHEEVFGEESFIVEIIDDLWEMILDNYGIPKDNTTDFPIPHSKEKIEEYASKGMFCRDYWTDLLFEFGEGKINKKNVIKELKNWNK